MDAWDEIKTWRRAKRAELIERRRAIPREIRAQASSSVMARLFDQIPDLGGAVIGFYWPIKGELDMRELVATCVTAGATAALPVVVEKNQPVEFHTWTPGCDMTTGLWNVPVPAVRDVVTPTLLLAPLVGFDTDCYRLGFGSGYYDRTLAALSPRPLVIGVGYENGRLASIHPQPHDIAMDAIASETSFTWREPKRRP
jgi:5-formyltetrahydrofolate cyclo-ligase